MLDPKLLRTDADNVSANLARRGFVLDVAALAALEERRKTVQVHADTLRAERNARSKAIGKAKGAGEDVAPLLAEVESLGAQLAAAEAALVEVQNDVEQLSMNLPNLIHDSRPRTSRSAAGARRARSISRSRITSRSASRAGRSTSSAPLRCRARGSRS